MFSHSYLDILLVWLFYHTQWTAEGSVFGAVSLWLFVCLWNISVTAGRICASRQIHTENEFGPSLGRIWRSRSKVIFGGLRAVYVW